MRSLSKSEFIDGENSLGFFVKLKLSWELKKRPKNSGFGK